ncbi:MAG TPA: hypothetical protein VKY90_08900 [Candidatus Dormibacteraeota bacterium]|nr:hypothetical protein [Candidatus Dormibacteraeota bacterium]
MLIAGLFAAGCGGPSSPPRLSGGPASTPVASLPAGASWVESLAFSGDVQGTMVGVVSGNSQLESECTGPASLSAGTWASTLYGQVGAAVYEVVVVVPRYRGPGTYQAPQVEVQVAKPDGSAVWDAGQGQPASFSVDIGQRSGTLDATLVNLATNQVGLHVTGTWSCGG